MKLHCSLKLGSVNSRVKKSAAFGSLVGFRSSALRCSEESWKDSTEEIAAKKAEFSQVTSQKNALHVEDGPLSGSGVPGSFYQQAVKFQRPPVVPWQKELANTVHLIGTVGYPTRIKYLNSGKVFARTSLEVKKSDKSIWIELSFWDELAEIATQHLKKDDHVYVSGRLVSHTIVDGDQKPRTLNKVVAKDLNFIQRNLQGTRHQVVGSTNVDFSKQNEHGGFSSSRKWPKQDATDIVSLWQIFFANPFEWWDNRKDKRNSKAPDFKHKDTGEALWIESIHNPDWVKSQLALLDSRIKHQWNGGETFSTRPRGSSWTF